jgi:16S rRNA (guanine966-N2)-methyltransferase
MRIIAGTHRGRPIESPRGDTTRPITDQAKETLFNKLFSLGLLADEDPEGNPTPWRMADVFCGTGSMGLECLSRGASHAVFVDRDRSARDGLERNLTAFGWHERARVVASDAMAAGWLGTEPLRLVFLDPPYPLSADARGMTQLTSLIQRCLPCLEQGGVLVFRTDAHTVHPEVAGYDHVRFTMGSMAVSFYQRPLPDETVTAAPAADGACP